MRTPTKILITSAAGVALTVSAAAPAGAIGIGLGPIVRDPLDLDSTAILGCLEAAPAHLQSHLLDANIVLGTTGDDDFSGDLTSGPDLICGGAGDDVVDLLMDDDVFLGQGGNDTVRTNLGTFLGGEGNDTVGLASDFDLPSPVYDRTGNFGYFEGEGGADRVSFNGPYLAGPRSST